MPKSLLPVSPDARTGFAARPTPLDKALAACGCAGPWTREGAEKVFQQEHDALRQGVMD
jgi:hypothetical protein